MQTVLADLTVVGCQAFATHTSRRTRIPATGRLQDLWSVASQTAITTRSEASGTLRRTSDVLAGSVLGRSSNHGVVGRTYQTDLSLLVTVHVGGDVAVRGRFEHGVH